MVFNLEDVPRDRIPALIAALAARLLCEPAAIASAPGPQPSEFHLLTVDEAAAKLGVDREWLYRRAKRLGFAVKLGAGTLRISSVALDDYIRKQTISIAPARRRRALDTSDKLIA